MKRVIAAAIVWPNALFIFGLLWLNTAPDMEQWLAPVLKDQQIEAVERVDDTVCWRWKWRKTHDAIPAGSAWSFVLLGTSVDYPAIVQRRQDGGVVSQPRNRNPGPGSSEFCADIPRTLANVSGLRIEGSLAYTPSHKLWLVWQDVPPVLVPPRSVTSEPTKQ